MKKKEKNVDPAENISADERLMQQQRRKEKKLFPLRVNSTTIILVPKSKCTKTYAESYNEKLKRI